MYYFVSQSGLLFVKPEMADRQSSGDHTSSSGRGSEPENDEEIQGAPRIHGVGKGPMVEGGIGIVPYAPGYIPIPDSDEELEDVVVRTLDEEDEVEEVDWDSVAAEGAGASSPSKGRRNPVSEVREGHPEDAPFPTVSEIPPKKSCVNDLAWATEEFYPSLVREEYRETLTPEVVALIPPARNDRAHDHSLGMCIYWRMPWCGFRLPISRFQRKLRQLFDVAPGQVTSAAWCTIASFEEFFRYFRKDLGCDAPTPALFGQYFVVSVLNDSFLTVKKKQGVTQIFDLGNPRKSRINAWNHGWAYLSKPEDIPSLNGVRVSWRPLKVACGPVIARDLSPNEVIVAGRIEKIVGS